MDLGEALASSEALRSNGRATRGGRRSIELLLWLGGALAALSIVHQWLYVGTHRFYLENRPEAIASAAQTARQRFEVRDGRVEPEIVAAEAQSLTFPVALRLPGRLLVHAVTKGVSTIEIAVVEGGSRRTLYRRAVSGEAEIAEPVPATTTALELVNQGEVRWVDPRVVDEPRSLPRVLLLLGFLGLAAWRFPRTRSTPRFSDISRSRSFMLGAMTLAVSLFLCLASLEAGLRAMGSRLPSWIAVERRNLGEARADPRWQDSAVYGPRLAPHVHAVCQWQHGDIVRMGFLAPDLVRHPAYTFPMTTDADGFRNADTPPTNATIAVLGDSFTDALTLPAELTWPRHLGDLLHASVRNYGTAGFGPGQELRVLKDYVLPRRPRVVVMAFFAGNDLQDAERFDSFEKGGGAFPSSGLGWKFKEVIARFDQLYVMSLYQGASHFVNDHDAPGGTGDPRPVDYSGEDPEAPAARQPSFDRGLFTVPVAGRTLRFAFLPPYLNCLKLSREELQASPGWAATRRSYREMQRLARLQGVRLVVMFIPSKSQVYLPLAESAFSKPALAQALAVSLRDVDHPPGPDPLLQNRLALNDLMRELCAEDGIPFLDLTDALQARLAQGSNVYFPDDSHWNAAGHETAAATLADWLHL